MMLLMFGILLFSIDQTATKARQGTQACRTSCSQNDKCLPRLASMAACILKPDKGIVVVELMTPTKCEWIFKKALSWLF
jgi:hypothetical protein